MSNIGGHPSAQDQSGQAGHRIAVLVGIAALVALVATLAIGYVVGREKLVGIASFGFLAMVAGVAIKRYGSFATPRRRLWSYGLASGAMLASAAALLAPKAIGQHPTYGRFAIAVGYLLGFAGHELGHLVSHYDLPLNATVSEPTLHDVTDRKRVEDRLREQNDMLRLFNEIIRHDIRNHMNVVLGYADLVGDRVDDPGVAGHVRTLTERSRHAVERTEIIRVLTELMLTGADGESRVDIVETLRESVADVTTTTELTATVNAPEPPVLVAADNSVEIVFDNVLTNAVNHNDAPDPHVHVTVGLEDSDDTVTVQIADNGPGIPDEVNRRLFGRGEKGPTSPSTGIRLYLVDELLDSYDGDI
jgi:signal transduction histidine kinase